MDYIDLRSDTVTKPSLGMREAMAKAEVGDDVFGEDPTVNRLQQKVADLLGKEAALYVPSGTMGNQICIKVHTQPGDEVIAEKGCHVFNYETAGMAFLSNVQVHTVEGKHGAFTVEDVKRAIRPKAYYMPRTRLICMENTHNRAGGTIIPIGVIKEMNSLARNERIQFHLDGARLWNACAETGISPKEYASYFDSVSVCLSKGLGAPVGSVIVGSNEFIADARRYRKIFGGGMRQAGVLAAAGLYALENNVNRLKEDHANAKFLARELSTIKGFDIDMESVQTNIIIISVEKLGKSPDEVLSLLKSRGVLLTLGNYMGVRAVTHLDVSSDQVAGSSDYQTVIQLTMLDKSRFKFKTQVRVRNYEIDWQGIVHNANYLLYFEVGRVAYLEHVGVKIDINSIQHESKVVVVRNEIDYRSPVHFDDVLDVHTRISFVRETSFAFEGILENSRTKILVAENVSFHVWLDHLTNRPMRVPDGFRSVISRFEGENALITTPTTFT